MSKIVIAVDLCTFVKLRKAALASGCRHVGKYCAEVIEREVNRAEERRARRLAAAGEGAK